MNILFISMLGIHLEERGIYSDLIHELIDAGHSVTLVDDQKKNRCIDSKDGLTLLPINLSITMFQCRYLKGMVSLLIEFIILITLKMKLKQQHFDLLLYATPPIMYTHILRFCKKNYQCSSFLMLKDIFPQNAVDEGLLSKKGFLYKYFRKKEKKLYQLSDYIGCMSKRNIRYLLTHNPGIPRSKVLLFPNSIKLHSLNRVQETKLSIRKKLGITKEKIVFVFGGNLGIAQGIPFLIKLLRTLENHPYAYFLIVGTGTDTDRIKELAQSQVNVQYLERLPRKEFDLLLSECNVGIVSLGGMYTIPNFPSRILSYMEAALPILAITDRVTDVRILLEKEAKCGRWSLYGDLPTAIRNVEAFVNEEQMRIDMGSNGRQYCEEHYDCMISIRILENLFQDNTKGESQV